LSKLDKLLNANEKVLWSGRPEKKAFVLPGLATIPFGLFFIAFFILWMWGGAFAEVPSIFALFGLVFLLVGFAIVIGPFLWQLLRYRNTEYMITDKRIVTQTGAIGLDTRFVDFDKIQEVYVKIGIIDRLFGTGSLYAMTAGYSGFGPATSPYGYGFGGGYGFRPSLAALKEPYQVQKLLQEAIERSKAAAQI
jgi:membrane protein YdbS with pleckstrin-like domain